MEFDNNIFDGRIRLISDRVQMKTIVKNHLLDNKASEDAFYICNLGEIINKHKKWIEYMPRVRPFYAVKCCNDLNVLRVLAGLGTGFDCASKNEMKSVLELGVDASDIIFANPAKQASHIRAAEEFGVQTMTFDNANELHKIKNLHPQAKLVIRIRCDAEVAQCQLGMKFGVLVEEAPGLIATAKELGLNVIGVSFHVGSGCMEPMVFKRAISSASWLFNMARELGYNFTLLDIGGGFPGNTGTSIAEIGKIVDESLNVYFPENGCGNGVEIIAEPGRFYVASAFTLCTQIHSKRNVVNTVEGDEKSKSFMYYINDGVYGSFNCVLYDHAVVRPETLQDIHTSDDKYETSIWGPTCDGLDCVCPNVLLPELYMGDWLIFNDMGAYTIVAAGTFNGFPIPKIQYVVAKDSWSTLREFMKEEMFVTENVPVFTKAGVGCNRDAVGWEDQGVEDHPFSLSLFYEYANDIPAQ